MFKQKKQNWQVLSFLYCFDPLEQEFGLATSEYPLAEQCHLIFPNILLGARFAGNGWVNCV